MPTVGGIVLGSFARLFHEKSVYADNGKYVKMKKKNRKRTRRRKGKLNDTAESWKDVK
jgi:uncharacterized protein Veg